MIALVVPDDWRAGGYQVVASSAQAAAEWDSFVLTSPNAMKAAYERLSDSPLTPIGSRQFPLKGKQNKPFWEYEITGGDRLYYAVDEEKRVVVVSVMKHATSTPAALKKVQSRRSEFDTLAEKQKADRQKAEKAQPTPSKAKKPRR